VQALKPAGSISVRRAQDKLWDALGAGLAEGYGTDIGTGERAAIPAVRWCALQAIVEQDRDVLRPAPHPPAGRIGYDAVELRREAILALWPPHRREDWDQALPVTVAPDGAGYMPLYCAAQWIATKGGSTEFDPRDTSFWHSAYAGLLARIASGEITVTGIRDGVGERLDAHLFASVRISYPFSDEPLDVILSDELYLSSCAYINDEHWRGGGDDNRQDRRGVAWSRPQVLKSDVARWWPIAPATPPDEHEPAIPERTGAPGRPSSMHLIEAEHSARWDRGEAEGTIAAEARVLRAWFQNDYTGSPVPSALTIENRIRNEHRKRKATPRI
jgi:hypothetical protein